MVTTVTAAQSLHTRTVPFFADDPEIDAETAIGVLLRGNSVTVIAEAPDKSWVRIRMTDGTEAYVNANYLAAYGGATSSPSGEGAGTTTPSVTFTPLETTTALYPMASGVRVYVQPDILSNSIDVLSMSDKVFATAISTNNEWYKIQFSATDTTFYYVQVAKMKTSAK